MAKKSRKLKALEYPYWPGPEYANEGKMVHIQGETTLHFFLPSQKGSILKEKNLLLKGANSFLF